MTEWENEVVAFYLGQPEEVDAEAETCKRFDINDSTLQIILEASLFESGL